jgi:hypothetical protein
MVMLMLMLLQCTHLLRVLPACVLVVPQQHSRIIASL